MVYSASRWIPASDNYLFKITSLAEEFKKRYLKLLLNAYLKDKLVFTKKTATLESKQGFQQLINSVSKKKWIAYAKRLFAGPQQVLDYLGRYTHRVAISNNRIISIDNSRVTFTYKDRQKEGEIKKMILDADEFIRRFLLHVLPKGLIKEMMLRLTGIDISCCPVCKKGKMIRIRKLPNYNLNSS